MFVMVLIASLMASEFSAAGGGLFGNSSHDCLVCAATADEARRLSSGEIEPKEGQWFVRYTTNDGLLRLFGHGGYEEKSQVVNCAYRAEPYPAGLFTGKFYAQEGAAWSEIFDSHIIAFCKIYKQKIPPHVRIMQHVNRLTSSLSESCQTLAQITPGQVAQLVGPDASDPKILFAIRMKLIFAFISQQNAAAGSNTRADDARVEFVLPQVLERAISSLRPDVQTLVGQNMESIMKVIFACPQMTPHIVFSEDSTDWVQMIQPCLPEYFELDHRIVEATRQSIKVVEDEFEMTGNREKHMAASALYEKQLAKYQAELGRESDATKVITGFMGNAELKDVVNQFITALRRELIHQHTLRDAA